jgi:Na+/glutamate symporter
MGIWGDAITVAPHFRGATMIKTTELGAGLCAFGLAVLVGGCVSEYKKEEAQEKQAKHMPVNCATAEGDIRMLQAEKVNTAQQVAAGVTMIVPVGLVVGVATSTEGQKYQVTTGDYNQMLDKKIAEIKQTCSVP